MVLPSLSALRIDNLSDTQASWTWDSGKYGISFSIDTAVREQIDGLNAEKSVAQMTPLAVLQVLREYAIQRLWDIHCAFPRVEFDSEHTSVKPTGSDDANEPFPESKTELINNVARWVHDVQNTLPSPPKDTRVPFIADGDGDVLERLPPDAIATAIDRALQHARAEQGDHELCVLKALHAIDTKLSESESGGSDVDSQSIRTWLLENKKMLTEPGIRELRLSPKPNWYQPSVRSARLQRWWKMNILLVKGDRIDNKQFVPSIDVPEVLNGSFYSGDLRIQGKERSGPAERVAALSLEHIIPIGHMSNTQLIRECSHPKHLAMITTMVFQPENSSRGDRFLPLGKSIVRMNRMQLSDRTAVYHTITTHSFTLARRQQAARMLAAGYLTLPMIERRPDPSTELGSRNGGLYENYRDDIYELLLNTITPGNLDKTEAGVQNTRSASDNKHKRIQFRRAWTWEVGLSLLLWYYLEQPCNPLATIAYRKAAGLQVEDDCELPYFKDLLFARLGNADFISKMMRREMREEVANTPGTSSDDKVSNVSYVANLPRIKDKINTLIAQKTTQKRQNNSQPSRAQRKRSK